MPRTKTVTSTKKNKASSSSKKTSSSSSSSSSSPSSRFTSKELFDAAEHAMHQNVEQAIALYTAAIMVPPSQRDMDTCFILEKRAQAHVANGDSQLAFTDFQQALTTTILNEQNQQQQLQQQQPTMEARSRMASLYLYMGQLSGGQEAVSHYQEGIKLLETCLAMEHNAPDEQQQQEQRQELQQQMALLCCSAAEVYLTDLCDEPTAEESCQALVDRALAVTTPPSIDALQTAASLALSQCKTEQALHYMQQVYQNHLKEPCQELAKLVGLLVVPNKEKRSVVVDGKQNSSSTAAANNDDDDDGAMELTADTDPLPGFEFRCQTAKLLLECSVHESGAEWCPEAAVAVLGSLLAENDEVIEIWLLVGDAFGFIREQQQQAAYYYQHALEMLQQVQTSLEHALDEVVSEEEEEELQQELDQVTCQFQQVQQKLLETANEATAPKENGDEEDDDKMKD